MNKTPILDHYKVVPQNVNPVMLIILVLHVMIIFTETNNQIVNVLKDIFKIQTEFVN